MEPRINLKQPAMTIRKHCESDTINYVTHETYVGQNSWIYKKNDEVMKLKWANEWSEFKKTPLNKEQLNQAKDFLEGLRHGKEMYAKLNEPTPIEKMIDGEGEFAVLFTNLNFDTAVLGRNPLFASMSDWIENVIDYWIEHETSLKLIIRVHPGEIKLVTPSSDSAIEVYSIFPYLKNARCIIAYHMEFV